MRPLSLMSAPLLLAALLLLVARAPQAAAYQNLVSENPLVCRAGYGQRGKKRSAGVEWIRTCKFSKFCWEATTTDIESMKQLFDFPWVSACLPACLPLDPLTA